MSDLIDRKQAFNVLSEYYHHRTKGQHEALKEALERVPSAQTETCDGCKHKGKWENEIEYGYNSPCTICKRRVNDNYER